MGREESHENEAIPSIVSCFTGKGGVPPFSDTCDAMGGRGVCQDNKKKHSIDLFMLLSLKKIGRFYCDNR